MILKRNLKLNEVDEAGTALKNIDRGRRDL